jgi:hypothetical protein
MTIPERDRSSLGVRRTLSTPIRQLDWTRPSDYLGLELALSAATANRRLPPISEYDKVEYAALPVNVCVFVLRCAAM